MANEQRDRASTQEKAKERGTVLREILSDEKKSALYGEMLKQQNNVGIAERLAKRPPETTEQDIEVLTGKGMDQFLEQMRNAETLSGMMKSGQLEKLLEGKSKKMQMMGKAIGVEGIRNAVMPQLEMLAMRNPARMKALLQSFGFMAQRETQQKEADTKLNALFEKYGISKEKYNEIMGNANLPESERNEQLKNLLNQKMGRVKGISLKTFEKNRQQRERDLQEQANGLTDRGEIENAKSQYESGLWNTGDLLGSVVFGNEGTQAAFNSILVGGNPEEQKEEMLSFSAMKEISLPQPDNLETSWNEWSAAETGAGRPVDKNRFFDSYTGGKTENKKGLWSEIMKKMIMGLAKF